ncbi:MAG: PIN domain-containing protein [Verrucomicrobiota bacterium]
MRVLVDSSVWIDYFSGASSTQAEALEQFVDKGEDICICGHILSEVLRGCRHDEQFSKVERRFAVLEFLPMTEATFKQAAVMYRSLRKSGLTLKNNVDTYIAAVAIESRVHLLHNDRDFQLISQQFPLQTISV